MPLGSARCSPATHHLFLPLLFALSTACGGSSGDTTGPDETETSVASVQVTPASATLEALQAQVDLGASAFDASGSIVSGAAFTWTSSAPGVASVDQNGTVTAEGPGSATITASTSGGSGWATIEVAQRVESVEVAPATATLNEVGGTQQFTASAYDPGGALVAGADFAWASDAPGVATVDNGLATAESEGEATISATSGGVVGSAVLTVELTGGGGGEEIVQLAAAGAGFHTCAVSISDTAYCWGQNLWGQIGDGSMDDRSRPTEVAGGHQFEQVGTTTTFSCGLPANGDLHCWGFAGYRLDPSDAPLTPQSFGNGVQLVRLSVGGDACGLSASGEAHCWVLNVQAFLVHEPVPGGHAFVDISAALHHTCALTEAGEAYCWGVNAQGQLGNGEMSDAHDTPVQVAGGLSFAILDAGAAHTCALTDAGRAYCWGVNAEGQLGDGTVDPRSVPTPVATDLAFVDISGGFETTCAVTVDGDVYCWGWDIGPGFPMTPQPIAIDGEFSTVSASAQHWCALSTGGTAYCWGRNQHGQLGRETTESSDYTPAPIEW